MRSAREILGRPRRPSWQTEPPSTLTSRWLRTSSSIRDRTGRSRCRCLERVASSELSFNLVGGVGCVHSTNTSGGCRPTPTAPSVCSPMRSLVLVATVLRHLLLWKHHKLRHLELPRLRSGHRTLFDPPPVWRAVRSRSMRPWTSSDPRRAPAAAPEWSALPSRRHRHSLIVPGPGCRRRIASLGGCLRVPSCVRSPTASAHRLEPELTYSESPGAEAGAFAFPCPPMNTRHLDGLTVLAGDPTFRRNSLEHMRGVPACPDWSWLAVV